ncbi:hypothetical protein LINPERPRIM_LOCUS16725 [Linum perenne]
MPGFGSRWISHDPYLENTLLKIEFTMLNMNPSKIFVSHAVSMATKRKIVPLLKRMSGRRQTRRQRNWRHLIKENRIVGAG